MSERADRNPKSIKIPGPDHPITIERNTHRIVIAVAGRAVAAIKDHVAFHPDRVDHRETAGRPRAIQA
jgi:uncharacterized protein (DUF427 family)